jgi:hypothetical protein
MVFRPSNLEKTAFERPCLLTLSLIVYAACIRSGIIDTGLCMQLYTLLFLVDDATEVAQQRLPRRPTSDRG